MDISDFRGGAARISRLRSDAGQKKKYFIIPIFSCTNTITMFVFWKVIGDVYGCKTLFYILHFT